MRRALDAVNSVAKSNRAHQALVYIENSQERCRLVADNGSTEIISAAVPLISTEESFEAWISGPKLAQIVREISGTNIQLTLGNHKIRVSGEGRARFQIQTNEGDLNDISHSGKYQEAFAGIMDLFDMVSYACAQDDARLAMQGVYIHRDEGDLLSMAATDGRRMSVVSRPLQPGKETVYPDEGVIIDVGSIRKIGSLFSECEDLEVYLDGARSEIFFRSNARGYEYAAKTIGGQYPNYKQVIPSKMKTPATLDRIEFERSLRQTMVMAAEPSKQIRMKFISGRLEMEASTPDAGEAADSMEIHYSGPEGMIAVNGNYMMEVIKKLKGDKFLMHFNRENPILLEDTEDEHFVNIVMPMKT